MKEQVFKGILKCFSIVWNKRNNIWQRDIIIELCKNEADMEFDNYVTYTFLNVTGLKINDNFEMSVCEPVVVTEDVSERKMEDINYSIYEVENMFSFMCEEILSE